MIHVRRHRREVASGKTISVRAHERQGGDDGVTPVPDWSRAPSVGELRQESAGIPLASEDWWDEDAPEQALCPRCGTLQPVTIDGGIARHDTSGNLGVRMLGEHCAGSGTVAVAVQADESHWRLTDPDAIYADQVRPGMTIRHPHGCSEADDGPTAGVMDVLAVSEPDSDGMVAVSSQHETVRIARDWPVHEHHHAAGDSAFTRMADDMREWRSRPEPVPSPAKPMHSALANALGCGTPEGLARYERGRAYREAGYRGPLDADNRIPDPDDPAGLDALRTLAALGETGA